MSFLEVAEGIAALSTPFIAIYIGRVAVKHTAAKEAKGAAVQQLLGNLGIKNVKMKEFNDLSNDGFAKVLVLARELRSPLGAAAMPVGLTKSLQELEGAMQMMAMLNPAGQPMGASQFVSGSAVPGPTRAVAGQQ